MSKEQAREFVEKMYNDDGFAIEVLKVADLYPGGKDDADAADRGAENFVKAGKALGYDFTDEEFEVEGKAYFNSIGTIKMLKTLTHFIRLNSKARKA